MFANIQINILWSKKILLSNPIKISYERIANLGF